MAKDIDKFVHDQLSVWPDVAARYRLVKAGSPVVMGKEGFPLSLGMEARSDDKCPLCKENFFDCQHTLPFEGRKGRKYNILVNREPDFPNHLVVARDVHVPQTIWHRFPDMLDLAVMLEGFLIFYNSPAGTSLPAHAHFQACPKGFFPMERAADRLLGTAGKGSGEIEEIASVRDARLYHYKGGKSIFFLKAATAKSMAKQFYRLLDCLNLMVEESEPLVNAYTWFTGGEYRAVVSLAPEEEERLLWRLTRTQPKIEVEIASGAEIGFEIISDGAGPQKVSFSEGKIDYNGVLYDEMVFEAVTISTLFAEPSFIICDKRFAGTLKFIAGDGCVRAVNVIGAEDYLLSVVSLLPREGLNEEAVRLRTALMRGGRLEERYVGLTEMADVKAREAIDETWGKTL